MFGWLHLLLQAGEIAECTTQLKRDMDDFSAAINKWAEANIGKLETIERIPPILPIGPIDTTYGRERDCLGRLVDHLVDFDTFLTRYLTPHPTACHHFTRDGCQYNEGGCWGFSNAAVGFRTKEDLKQYRSWLKTNKKN